MIVLKSKEEIEKIRKASRIVAEVLAKLKEMVQPGVTTEELDRVAEETIRARGALPAFKGYRGFKKSICTSVNEQVVHGIPSSQVVLKEGDIVGVDCGAIVDGFYGDGARTYPVGEVDSDSQRLMQVTEEGLRAGIEQMRVGNRLGDVSAAIEEAAKKCHYGVVRDFVGHGIGRQLHEEPQVPNFGRPGAGIRLSEGLVLAIEPMFTLGSHEIKVLEDGWTAVTTDGRRAAHFEETIALTEKGPEVLTVL